MSYNSEYDMLHILAKETVFSHAFHYRSHVREPFCSYRGIALSQWDDIFSHQNVAADIIVA